MALGALLIAAALAWRLPPLWGSEPLLTHWLIDWRSPGFVFGNFIDYVLLCLAVAPGIVLFQLGLNYFQQSSDRISTK
jgi:hypothetical protein